MSDFLSLCVDWIWGPPMLITLVGGGFVLAWRTRLKPLLGLWHAIQLLKKPATIDQQKLGQLSHFQALSNALASTVGLGNIAGVAVALTQGGPGAIFWMWMAALIGMNTKFVECTLSQMHRGFNYRGEIQGGPMYAIWLAGPRSLRSLAYVFAVAALFGNIALFQMNQVTIFFADQFAVPNHYVAVPLVLGCGVVLIGGIRWLGFVNSFLVPIMCLLYVSLGFYIVINNWFEVPGILMKIFSEAFALNSVYAGGLGAVISTGFKRAAFSNEAGVGTAPMAHAQAQTDEPVTEGLVAMLGPFLDTIVVCTVTAIIILVSFPDLPQGQIEGIELTLKAFELQLGTSGAWFLGISILLFGFTTVIGSANYSERAWDFLFGGYGIFKRSLFIAWYCPMLLMGSVLSLADLINFLDICFALMAFPNMVNSLVLGPSVYRALDQYFVKHRIGLNKQHEGL